MSILGMTKKDDGTIQRDKENKMANREDIASQIEELKRQIRNKQERLGIASGSLDADKLRMELGELERKLKLLQISFDNS